MAKTLTTVAVMKLKPGRDCREVSDGGCPGLRLSIQPSGHRSWIIRYKRPDGTSLSSPSAPATRRGRNWKASR